MEDIEFNLLDEPWIRVMKPDCSVEEVSLTDALLHAHEYEDLAGELPTQDIAVLRVLLAVLHTIFGRVDIDGDPDPIDEDNALERWGELWDLGAFPEKPVQDYLNQWHERFWLFHPERPFFQVPEANIGSYYSSKKLNGEISESSNKERIFSSQTGFEKENLSFGEAARWLIHLMAFDDASVKTNTGTGTGWLGKLGLIVAQGNNLFETLLLNLTFLKNGNKEWEKNKPVWEMENCKPIDKCEIPMPDNLAELYTIQSRRILLKREKNYVIGFYSMGGDYFSEANSVNEQMTLWKKQKNAKGEIVGIIPFRHDLSKQIWRNFSLIASEKESSQTPGIVLWISNLIDEGLFKKNEKFRFRFASIKYDSKGQSTFEYFNDYLNFHADLLSNKGKPWISRIEEEIEYLDKIANLMYDLTDEISLASGKTTSDYSYYSNYIKEQYYYNVDEPFRLWLIKLSSDQSPEEMNQLQIEWRKKVISFAKRFGQELIDVSGLQAFSGRKITDKKKNTLYVSAPEAYFSFVNRLNHIYDSKGA